MMIIIIIIAGIVTIFFCLQKDLIGSFSDDLANESEHDKSEQAPFWYRPIDVDLADISWLIHDYGEPGIRNKYLILSSFVKKYFCYVSYVLNC